MSDFFIGDRTGQCGNRRRGETEGDAMGRQAETGGMWPQVKEPRVDGHHQRLKEVKKPLLWGCPREHGPVSALISDFSLLELSEKKFLLFLAIQFGAICYSSPGTRIHSALSPDLWIRRRDLAACRHKRVPRPAWRWLKSHSV